MRAISDRMATTSTPAIMIYVWERLAGNSRAKGETGKGRGALFLLAVVPILSGTACACFTPTRLVRLSTGGPSGGFPIAAL